MDTLLRPARVTYLSYSFSTPSRVTDPSCTRRKLAQSPGTPCASRRLPSCARARCLNQEEEIILIAVY
ncbi:hypothetical protein NDU88_006079 [Pleurodeles waltl]|uniref:Uncharacterized protein n=1 Tax=Pleurodeles waltl TaxID=8319 RepID=A0AAV7N314_PLEWA|nr:hypothetical protein NDU88_006079 [Pleurodeles waltl]